MTDPEPTNEIRTDVEIDAPAERVWRVLTAFDEYDEWNPVMRIHGRPNLGAHLLVDLRMPGTTARQFRPTVVAVDRDPEGREFRWLGHLYVEGLFDGEHSFRVEPIDDGRSRFVHAESFDGLLAGLVVRRYGSRFRDGFEAMNAALKARAESMETVEADEPMETDEADEPMETDDSDGPIGADDPAATGDDDAADRAEPTAADGEGDAASTAGAADDDAPRVDPTADATGR